MRAIEEIKHQIAINEKSILAHAKCVELLMIDGFEIDAIDCHTSAIKYLQNEIKVYKWVLDESV